MAASPFVINNHLGDDTSSSSSMDMSQKEAVLFDNQSSPNLSNKTKDSTYCSQQLRVKRQMNDLVLESKFTQLTNENEILRAKIEMLKRISSYSNQSNSHLF